MKKNIAQETREQFNYIKHEVKRGNENVIRDKWNCGKNAPKQWCKTMVERLSIKLFGAKAIDK